jgi:hypothetical protein
LKTAQPQPAGTKIKCPKCLTIFTVEDAANRAVPPPIMNVAVRPPIPERKPRQEPEEYDAPFYEERPRRRRAAAGELSNDYRIDLGEWFGYATGHYSAVVGPMIGFTLILFAVNLLSGFLPLIGALVPFFVVMPMQTGYKAVCLRQLKGKNWAFGDFFAGFQQYGTVLLLGLLGGLLSFACMLPTLVVAILAFVLTANMRGNGPPVFLVGAGLFALLNACALVYVMIRATFFAVPLVFDRKYSAIEAIQGSWVLSRGHFWGLFLVGLVLVLMLFFSAILSCGLGALFTIPLYELTLTAGYLLVAGTKRPKQPSSRRESYDDERPYAEDAFRG